MSILIKNGHIITATDNYVADIFIEGETITAIGSNFKNPAADIIDATDKFIFPGGVDPHVHLALPSMGTVSSDDYASGTAAAVFGGTTTVLDFAIQEKGKMMHDALAEWKKKALDNAFCDYSHHMNVTDFNKETAGEVKQIIEKEGITSFKTFMAYKDVLMMEDEEILGLMEEVKKHDGIVTVHATNGPMIDILKNKFYSEGKKAPLFHYLSQPEITESEASGRFVEMARFSGVPAYIVHMTCEDALNHVREAAKKNQKIFIETCIQYLLLDASVYEMPGFDGAKWVMSPPLRTKKDRAALWAGINQGLIQVVATDHCPFKLEQKKRGINDFTKIPNGHPAVEHRLELLFSEGVNKGRISLNKFVEVTAANPAKIFGMFPKKGAIAVGSDADLVIFDHHKKHKISAKSHHHNCDYSCYEGWEVAGKVETVLIRGKIAMQDNELKVPKGYGKFLRREKSSLVI